MVRRYTVWASGRLDIVPDRYKSLYQWVLPGKYLGYVVFATFSWVSREPSSVADATSLIYNSVWTPVVGLAALACLLSVVFCSHPRWELLSVAALVGAMFTYPMTLVISGFTQHNDLKIGLAGMILGGLLFPTWRLLDLVKLVPRLPRGRLADTRKGVL